ncbi:MAG: discoidin domain-containing protein [Bacteroidales bacterium]|nr:discoidin domain-containing protein [Bacteroidales bacterium]
MMTKYIFYFFLTIASIACSRYPSHVERALKFAGNNRIELEKTLEYYKDDPLKYRAALFLIGNMPGHYSYSNVAYLDTYYNELDSLFVITRNADNETKSSLFAEVKGKYSRNNLNRISDAQLISSDYLIANIDHAFSVWQNEKWATHLNFDEFCEYLLPYKVCEGQLITEDWRFDFDNFATENLDKLSYCKLFQNSTLKACEIVNMELIDLVKPRWDRGLPTEIPIRRMSTLSKIPHGLCEDYNSLAAAVMRSKGIPVAIDFTPQWPFRGYGHSWNVLFDNTGNNIAFEGSMERPGVPHKPFYIYAKIYRNTYSVNKEIEKINATDVYVPDIFRNVFIKDVTHEYMSTVDVKMKVSKSSKSKYAYLSVFDNKSWAIVNWGKRSFGKATFKNIGKDVLYLPVGMTNRGIAAIADPFIVDCNGKVTSIKADTENKQTMILYRKYPVLPHVYAVMDRIVGGQFQASNHSDFKNFIVFHTIDKYGVTAEDVFFDNSVKYRYWRYFSAPLGRTNIAELVFFEKESANPIRGKIIGTPGYYWDADDERFTKEGAFDGNALTFYSSPDRSGNWVGMDFGEPVAINRIYYIPRSDGNLIEIGDHYELFYWNDRQWQSLGKQQATGSRLIFENCPSNGLYLLRNHTKGIEERIFTYENGKQVWW